MNFYYEVFGLRMLHSFRKRGSISFAVVGVVLLVLFMLGVGVKYFTRGVTRATQGVIGGQFALAVARSAVDEAWSELAVRLNDPEDELGKLFLSPGGPESFSFEIEPKDTRNAYPPYILIGDVEVAVHKQWPVWEGYPFHKYGYISCKVVVNVERFFSDYAKSTVEVSRTLQEVREFRVIQPVPPYPFDTMTCFFVCPFHLYDFERCYRIIQQKVEKAIRKAEKKARKKGWHGHAPRPFEDNTDVYKYFPDYKYPPFPYNARHPKPAAYDTDASYDPAMTDMDNYLFSCRDKLEGRDFKLYWPEDFHNGNSQLMDQLQDELSQLQSSGVTSAAAVDPAKMQQLNQMLADLKDSDEMKAYESGIRYAMSHYLDIWGYINEDSVQTFNDLYMRPIIDADSQGAIRVEENAKWIRSMYASHVFPSQDELWNEIGRPRGNPSRVFLDGVYVVEGKVDVNFAYEGKGCIISMFEPQGGGDSDGIIVGRCRRADPDSDSVCTLWAFQSNIRLETDEVVEAALMAQVGTIHNLTTQKILGNVMVAFFDMDRIWGPKVGSKRIPYGYVIEYDKRLAPMDDSGNPRAARQRVLISPNILADFIWREIH